MLEIIRHLLYFARIAGKFILFEAFEYFFRFVPRSLLRSEEGNQGWGYPAACSGVVHLAVKSQWIDPVIGKLTGISVIKTSYTVKIPTGTTVYSGPVGYQEEIYLGGEDIIQTFIQEPWLIEGVEVISSIPLH